MIILTLIISTQFYKIWPNLFCFLFLLQKVDNKVNITYEFNHLLIPYEFNNIKSVYEGFCGTCNVEIQEETFNNSTFTKTPEWLALKRFVLNPLNNDNECFQHCYTFFIQGTNWKNLL